MPSGIYPRIPGEPYFPGTSPAARHARVTKARGRAKEYTCPCGQQAHDWSYNHGEDPGNVMSYEPLCRKCHIAKDKTATSESRKTAAAKVGRLNKGRKRPDVSARNAGNKYARKCSDGCTCGKHLETWRKRKSA